MDTQLSTSISPFCRILGSLFFYSPTTPQNQPLITLLQGNEWLADCDFLTENKLVEIRKNLQKDSDEQLENDYQTLFIGPNNLPAPPWGSVYLDKESVIFGESLLELRHFLHTNQINLSLNQNEPEDHIGLMLMLTAYLIEQHPTLLKPFLSIHFLPWVYRFLELLNAEKIPFYQGIGQLTEALLRHLQKKLEITPLALEIYR